MDAPAAACPDVAIVGGGMAGAALALLLVQRLPSSQVLLVEQQPFPTAAGDTLALPSFDARATALACSSQQILQALGLWEPLAAVAEPIRAVHVSERQRPAGLLMQAGDLALPALGFVVENRQLGHVLLQAVQAEPRIQLANPASVAHLRLHPDAVELAVQGAGPGTVRARLAVLADGTHSGLRQQLGIAADSEPYGQCALIANIVTQLPHRGVAYERFTDAGPMALLPLADHGVAAAPEHRAALVWTVPESEADALLALPDEAFLAQAQARFGERAGQWLRVGTRHTYPLALVQAREQVRSRIVLLGNAAHSLHPVAGQGFNLILRDCEALADTLAEAVAAGRDPGHLAVLQAYVQRQAWDQQKTVGLSDALPRLFSNREPARAVARLAGMVGLDFLPGLRDWFAREATGL